ncbi:putative arabinose operon control protein fused with periplasmic ligand-binding sensor domain [Vibrio nigripulchritudo MADA3029]|uniref:AraC family transcriptional regulator n=1 Tax=Vibrio nigripulchritudo TaxID=28173 RepID=UPI0003B237CE|nr:AraC family transcriptional regulator [Vibrio nigripulchritudo]CCN48460.1 putative arabinose operon control protein fused with periplasmic ligand-binding sensor domain [Vibrio nigripulchritudo MADA3020]CCN52232.1 putative arabinose operon control protein fused with periplasmic ligand-binding sensor domain [Vibrio nigripulchritudo MADA3021]CCN58044.1 putative arabinose operon control protein fused with periplasmic ligand-binding sensor domain [Vibrio nigripulchritudo MADA3029]
MITRVVFILILLVASQSLRAHEDNSIFYPLPFQMQGQSLTAKNLISGPDGGLWIHDIHGQLRFFDGQHILPRSGSVFERKLAQVAYSRQYFWFAEKNQIYRFKPNYERELIATLPANRQVLRIGVSSRYIWASTAEHLYTLNLDDESLTEFPLNFVYRSSSKNRVIINDAKYVDGRWILGTTEGVYFNQGKKFYHIRSSAKHHIEALHFSLKRRELLVGTLRGARIISIDNESSESKVIGRSHVLAIEETDTSYWLGTENGIYIYHFLTGETTHIASNYQDDYALPGDHIYDLYNDGQGGIWVATNKGINYFSLYSRLFERVRFGNTLQHLGLGNIKQVFTSTDGTHWIGTDQGFYKLNPKNMHHPKRLLEGCVNDLVQQGDHLWLAMTDGLRRFNIRTLELETDLLPSQLNQREINRITVDSSGMLWVATEEGLIRYQPEEKAIENFGYGWVARQYFPTQITHLYTSASGTVWIGTDHGLYYYINGRLQLDRQGDALLARTLDMSEAIDGKTWRISSRGLSLYDPKTRSQKGVQLFEPDIKPLCSVTTKRGMWLSTSKGLSFYSNEGQLLHHYGAPFGLINNEFLPDVCSVGPNGDSLIFGSKLGVILTSETALKATQLPQSKVKFGQVLLDRKPFEFAPDSSKSYVVPHGENLSFVLGVLPDFDVWSLEYRLLGSRNEDWISLQGSQLTFDYLLPGSYELQVRTSTQSEVEAEGSSFSFLVETPWYMSGWFIAYLILCLIIFAGLIVLWRSRQIRRINKALRDKVELRTSQLKHQSDMLVNSNKLLKRQINIRQSYIDNLAGKTKGVFEDICQSGAESGQFKGAFYLLQQIVDLGFKKRGESRASHDLNMVCDAVITHWEEELARQGVQLNVYKSPAAISVYIEQFNLDFVLHGMLANVSRRSKRGDKIELMVVTHEDMCGFRIQDTGNPISQQEVLGYNSFNQKYSGEEWSALTDTSLQGLRRYVEFGGGECYFRKKDSNINIIDALWSNAPTEINEEPESSREFVIPAPAIVEPDSEELPTEEELWLTRILELVDAHYHDPDFGTTQVAKMIYTSERSLQRKFKSQTGKTFKEYLNETRLEKACQRLISGEKVSDVAYDTGFNDPSYFSQRFKHHYGISPSKFIEANIGA